jgi:hypothetical protein
VYDLKEVAVSGALLPIDPTVMTFNAVSLSGVVKLISDISYLGQRTYELTARYNIPINYKATKTFKLNILSQCISNVVTPVPFAFPTYYIADPSLMVTLPPWLSKYSICEPFTYSAFLMKDGGERPLPEFVQFNPSFKKFTLQTGNPFLEGVYTIKVNATTPWTLATPTSYLFNVTIAC